MTDQHLDHMGRPLVAITGLGVVTSLGVGRDDNWSALTAGTSGIHAIKRFPTEGLSTKIAGTIDFLNGGFETASDLSYGLAELAIEEAVAQADLSNRSFPGPLFAAVPPVEMEWPHRFEIYDKADRTNADEARLLAGARTGDWPGLYERCAYAGVAERISDKFGTRGVPISLSTACASGATAIQLGVEAIRRGECDSALCVGTDGSIHVEALVRFSLLSALSTQNDPAEKASKPFSKNRDGFVMAEGAGALVLENYASAKARGVKILGVLRGIGERADDFHRTRSKPDGSAVIGAVNAVMSDAGVAPEEIDYVNAHGTGTPENDKMEHLTLDHVLGDHLANVPVSSNKSMIGHTLTAAGAIEAVFTTMTIGQGRIPPTINYDEPDPAIAIDVVPNEARDAPVQTAISNSFGFGGQNVCLIIAAP